MKPKIYRTIYDSNRYPVIVSETGSYVTDGRKPFDTPDAVYDFCSRESGDPSPSQEDIATTRKIAAASETVGVRFLDHIIVGDGHYYSFKERGDIS